MGGLCHPGKADKGREARPGPTPGAPSGAPDLALPLVPQAVRLTWPDPLPVRLQQLRDCYTSAPALQQIPAVCDWWGHFWGHRPARRQKKMFEINDLGRSFGLFLPCQIFRTLTPGASFR